MPEAQITVTNTLTDLERVTRTDNLGDILCWLVCPSLEPTWSSADKANFVQSQSTPVTLAGGTARHG